MGELVNEQYKDLIVYVPGKPVSETERELGISGCIKLASNENPLGPSPKALAAVADYMRQGHEYPDGGAFYLKQKIAAFHDISPENLITTNGTNELIEMLIRTTMLADENMIYGGYSFIIYKLCAMAANRQVRTVPFKDMRIDLEAMAAAVDEKTKLIFLDNPNNPCGTYFTKDEFDRFLAAIPDDVVVVYDEAYCHYADAEDYPQGFDYLNKRERFIVMRTFSKAYGLAGFRIGYGVGNKELIGYVNKGRQPFNCNSMGQVAALAALDDQEHVDNSVRMNKSEMLRLMSAYDSLGLGYQPSQTNFLLVDFKKDIMEVYDKLLRQGVIVRPMAGYGLKTSARVSIGTPEENDKLLKAIPNI